MMSGLTCIHRGLACSGEEYLKVGERRWLAGFCSPRDERTTETNLGDNLQFLPLTILRLRHRSLQPLQRLAVESLPHPQISNSNLCPPPLPGGPETGPPSSRALPPMEQTRTQTHRRTRNYQLDLPPGRAHQHGKLLTHPLQDTQPIILRQRLQKIPNRIPLIHPSHMPLQLLHNLRLIPRTQRRRRQNKRQLRILLKHLRERGNRFGRTIQRRRLGRRGILYDNTHTPRQPHLHPSPAPASPQPNHPQPVPPPGAGDHPSNHT